MPKLDAKSVVLGVVLGMFVVPRVTAAIGKKK